jgi:hypothetical protein
MEKWENFSAFLVHLVRQFEGGKSVAFYLVVLANLFQLVAADLSDDELSLLRTNPEANVIKRSTPIFATHRLSKAGPFQR